MKSIQSVFFGILVYFLAACGLKPPDAQQRSQELIGLMDSYGSFEGTIHWCQNIIRTNNFKEMIIPEKNYPQGLAETGVIAIALTLSAQNNSKAVKLYFSMGPVMELIYVTEDDLNIDTYDVAYEITNRVYYLWGAN